MKYSINEFTGLPLAENEEIERVAPIYEFGMLGPKVQSGDFVVMTSERVLTCHCKSSLSRALQQDDGRFTLEKLLISIATPTRDPRQQIMFLEKLWEAPWQSVRSLSQGRFGFHLTWKLDTESYGSRRFVLLDHGYGTRGFIECAVDREIPIDGGIDRDHAYGAYARSLRFPQTITDTVTLENVTRTGKRIDSVCSISSHEVGDADAEFLMNGIRATLIERICEEDGDDLFRLMCSYTLSYECRDDSGKQLCRFSLTAADLPGLES